MESKGMGDVIGTAAPVVEGYGVGMSGIAAYNKSEADRTAYSMQADVSETNAVMAREQAADAIRRGQTAEVSSQLRTRQLKGAQMAAMAANGVALGEGSALNILSDTDFMGANDAAVIHANALKEAYGYQVQESNYRSNADMLRYRAASESPITARNTALLTGASTVARRWYGVRHNLADQS